MAFPTAVQKDSDPEFLMPYQPCGFRDPRPERCYAGTSEAVLSPRCAVSREEHPVHVRRDMEHNFLFRIEPQPGGRAVILVQSAVKPDWSYAFHNAGHLLSAPVEVRSFTQRFHPHQSFRFRILANPVRKVSPRSLDFEGKPFPERWHRKDVPVPTADLRKWLERRAEPGWSAPKNSEDMQVPPGFCLVDLTEIQAGYQYVNETMEKGGGRRLRSARYEGVLEVTNADHFRNTVIKGIGPAKAFGFGLLSIAPVRS